MTRLFLLLFTLSLALTQNNTCYANCKAGYCQSTNAQYCTDCDLGLININNMCIGSSSQAAPIMYLKPNSKNTLTDSTSNPLNCSVSNSVSGSNVPMAFSPTIGSTFTRSFAIPYQHIYLQVKFNSIIASINTTPNTPTLLLNIFTATGKTIFTTVKSFTSTGNPVNCSSNYQAFDVFNVDAKFASTDTTVLVEVRSSGTTNTNIALSDFQLYYGNCSQQCGQCIGPTNQECTTCRGLLTTISSSQCSNCSPGFYQNVICLPCPIECATCSFSNNQIKCLTCNSNIAFSTTSTLGCQTNYSKISTATDQNFNITSWLSTESLGDIVTQCGYYSLVGGISIGVAGSSVYFTQANLPAHTSLYIYFTLFLIDQAVGDINAYQIAVDKVVQNDNFTIEAAQGTSLTNQCGTSAPEFAIRKEFIFSHSGDSVEVRILFLKDYVGIRDIYIIANNQTNVYNCYSENNGSCTACRNGYQLVNNTCNTCGDGYYEVNLTCHVCPITCKTCNMTNLQVICLSCQTPLTLDDIYCVDSSQTLFSADIVQGVTDFTKKQSWTLYPRLQNFGRATCGTTPILGSSDIKFKFLSMKKTFTGLPSHTGVTIFFDFYQIDDYANDDSVKFILNSNTIIYKPSNIKMNLCGNGSADAIVPVYLTDSSHSASTLDFQVRIDVMGKIGINNIMIYLLNGNSPSPAYQIESVPTYSVSTPPIKGLTVKLTFPAPYTSTVDTNLAFAFNAKSSVARLLQGSYPKAIIQNSSMNNNRQLLYLIDLSQDYSNSQLQARAASPSNIYFTDGNGNKDLISQQIVASTMPRYINMDVDNVKNRSSTRNLYNLFRGCAILALFIGIASFLVGMSSAFDDFFILCQLIFVHVFIQLDYNPPSIRIPFEGLHIVQFLQWLPWAARQSIQGGIIPSNLYQKSPLVYEQYYEDIVFARTIYQTILYFALILIFWTIMHVLLTVWDAKHPKTKYSNYFLYFYHNYDSKYIAMVDKIVRFAYFTVAWACVLQFTHLSNEPKSFNIWNSILVFVFFAAVLIYPAVMFYILRKISLTLSSNTFNKNYEELRVDSEKLYYYLIRYYKLIAIACAIGFLHAASPVIPLIILIVLNLADTLLLIFLKPLGMIQPEIIQATIFYPTYPLVYYYTSIIQQILFIILQILFLVLYGQRNGSSSSVYMGIGYAICGFVVLLLLNGLFRLFWGFMKLAQHCYIERQSFEQSVQKQIEQNRDPAQEHPIIQNALKSQANISMRELSRMQSKKMSYVSRIRG